MKSFFIKTLACILSVLLVVWLVIPERVFANGWPTSKPVFGTGIIEFDANRYLTL